MGVCGRVANGWEALERVPYRLVSNASTYFLFGGLYLSVSFTDLRAVYAFLLDFVSRFYLCTCTH